jgi:hypothetical protein
MHSAFRSSSWTKATVSNEVDLDFGDKARDDSILINCL